MKTVIDFPEFPYYLTVSKITDIESDTVTVVVESQIHVDKLVKLPMMWSVDFVRKKEKEFLGDIFSYVVKVYGLKRMPTKYW